MDFNLSSLFVCLLITILACYWVVRGERLKLRVFFILFYAFFLLYCGIGGTAKAANPIYMIYYYSYLAIITLVFLAFKQHYKYNVTKIYATNCVIDDYIEAKSLNIIILYSIINLSTLLFPSNRIMLLFNPPIADINTHLDFYREGSTFGVIDFARILMLPFFYWALSHLRCKNVIVICFFLLLNMYIEYCCNSYMGREPMLMLIVIVSMYIYNNTKHKQMLLITGILLVPLLGLFFVQYSFVRVGYGMEDISYGDAMNTLIEQESNYPLQFDSYYNKSGGYEGDYFEWLFLLPLPGFLKGGHGGALFNELFTNVSSNRYSWESGFSIALPGLVGDSIFLFKQFFFIHAIILSTSISLFVRYFEKYASFEFLYYYVLMRLSMGPARSGTQGPYSFIFKAALIFIILVSFIIKKKQYNRKYLLK